MKKYIFPSKRHLIKKGDEYYSECFMKWVRFEKWHFGKNWVKYSCIVRREVKK